MLILVIATVVMTGCATTPETKFYTLISARDGLISADKKTAYFSSVIGLMPVEIPDYIDRPQLVKRRPDGQVLRADFDKWAGSIRTDIERVIAENISAVTGSSQVLRFPWRKSEAVEYRLSIRIERLDGTPGGNVNLSARWMLFGRDGKTLLHTQETGTAEPVYGNTYKDLVHAQSRALLSLSMNISDWLHKTEQNR